TPSSTPCPYTTLFRSVRGLLQPVEEAARPGRAQRVAERPDVVPPFQVQLPGQVRDRHAVVETLVGVGPVAHPRVAGVHQLTAIRSEEHTSELQSRENL